MALTHRTRAAFRILSVLLPSLVVSVLSSASSSKRVFPGAEWEYDKSRLSPKVAAETDAFIRTLDTTGLIVVKGGKIAYQYGDVSEAVYVASIRKSVLSMLYGRYIASGTIRLDATLRDLGMSDVGGLLPIEERARVVDLITARSGVFHPASNDGDLLQFAPTRGSYKPGTFWLYSNWDFNAAGAVFEMATGRNMYDLLRENLAVPLEMQDFNRQLQTKSEDRTRSLFPAYSMWLSARDMARLGYLMLREGKWHEHQLIPADWVRRSTRATTHVSKLHPDSMLSGPFGYGYMWWVWDGRFALGPYRGAYTASGAHGQWITILPKVDMVVVHTASWSPSGSPRHSVAMSSYYRLLDLLTENQPASPEELRKWTANATSPAPHADK
jgi:CubicO group peptidase (beta-lactamase class C family)